MRCRRGLFLLDIRLLALRQGIVQKLFWRAAVYAMSCRIHHCVRGQLIHCQLQRVRIAGAARDVWARCLLHCRLVEQQPMDRLVRFSKPRNKGGRQRQHYSRASCWSSGVCVRPERGLDDAVAAALIAAVIAIPLGIALTRSASPWAMTAALTVANIGQATPVIGVLVILALLLGIGPSTAIIALVAFSFLPVLRNTLVGLQGVDPALIQAARGMGMRTSQILFSVELPLAAQKIISGFRTALVFSLGAATLATFINAGGLGEAIVIGLKLNRIAILLTGAVLVSALVLMLDWLVGIVEVALTPRGLD